MVAKKLLIKAKTFLIECRRIWTVTRKPTKEEFKIIVKVTAIGMAAIGMIGFIINMLWQMFIA